MRLLERFAGECRVWRLDQLTPGLLDEFLASRPRSRPRSFNHLLGVVAGLMDWAVAQELLEASPLRARRRRVTSARVPFLFDAAQARRLLDAAAALPDNARAAQRGPAYRTIFALCYGLGLRPAKPADCASATSTPSATCSSWRAASSARAASSRTGRASPRWSASRLGRRRAAGVPPPAAPLFSFDGGAACTPARPARSFTGWWRLSAWPSPKGSRRRRCTASATRSRSGACFAGIARDSTRSRLHQLSTFMGHVDPASTAIYLTITPALLAEANRRFEAFAPLAGTEAPR